MLPAKYWLRGCSQEQQEIFEERRGSGAANLHLEAKSEEAARRSAAAKRALEHEQQQALLKEQHHGEELQRLQVRVMTSLVPPYSLHTAY